MTPETKNRVGRPLKFKDAQELQTKIDDYFDNTPVDKWTWTGLALHLDTSRETLREYQERPEFVDPLKRALLKVENGYEIDAKLHGRAGSIFALKNFGWHDRTETDITTGGEQITQTIPPEIMAAFAKSLTESTKQE